MSIERYGELIDGFSSKSILVVGDVMLDRFIWGSVSRISPEAPVPVVRVRKESIYPGGAANVARNLIPFAGRVHMVGIVGTDDNGGILMKSLSDGGIETEGMVRDESYATITKTRVIARQQQVVRFDHENPVESTAAQVSEVKDFLAKEAGELDAVIIEDYGKGFVTQALVDAIVPLAREGGLVSTVDPNAGHGLNWKGVTAVKPNRLEAYSEVGVSGDTGTVPEDPSKDTVLLDVGRKLLDLWDTGIVPVTLGEHGMMLFERGKKPHHIPTKAQDVFDVSGAGDTAIALFTLALTAGASAVEAAEIANYASGVVVGKLGTATLGVGELLEAIARG